MFCLFLFLLILEYIEKTKQPGCFRVWLKKITEHDEVLLFRRLKNGDIVWLAKAAYIFCISLGFSDVTDFYSFTSFDSNVEHCILVFYIKTF